MACRREGQFTSRGAGTEIGALYLVGRRQSIECFTSMIVLVFASQISTCGRRGR
jgi:hypothetical protein